MKRSRLPLTALRSFEAAGRLESFTGAAGELFISQAAISRQIRELETLLGRPLFERRHRSVRLTRAGQDLLSVLTPSFDAISGRLDVLSEQADHAVVSVSAEPSFAACWLVPQLAEFQRAYPTIDVNVEADARLVEFRGKEGSVAIRHSLAASGWPRAESRYLGDCRITPVMSPLLVEEGGLPAVPGDLLRYPLLHEGRRDIWAKWFEAAGLPSVRSDRGLVYTDEGLVLQAALRGQGIALVDERFSAEDVKAGRLIRPFDLCLPYGAYWIVTRRFDGLPKPTSSFVTWLEDRFSGLDGSPG